MHACAAPRAAHVPNTPRTSAHCINWPAQKMRCKAQFEAHARTYMHAAVRAAPQSARGAPLCRSACMHACVLKPCRPPTGIWAHIDACANVHEYAIHAPDPQTLSLDLLERPLLQVLVHEAHGVEHDALRPGLVPRLGHAAHQLCKDRPHLLLLCSGCDVGGRLPC